VENAGLENAGLENAGHGTLKYGQRNKTSAVTMSSVNERRWRKSTGIEN